MAKLIKKVVRCRHDFAGVPASYTPNERPPAGFKVAGRMVCLDCGKELPAYWDQVNVPQQLPTRYEALAALSSGVAES